MAPHPGGTPPKPTGPRSATTAWSDQWDDAATPNAMMESFMKTLKVEGVNPMVFETEDDVAQHLPRFIDSYNERRLHSALRYLSPNRFEEQQPRKPVKSAA